MKNKPCTVIADESSDTSNQKQLCIAVWFWDNQAFCMSGSKIIHFEQTNDFRLFLCILGEALANVIMEEMERLDIDMTLCLGQSYNRESNVSGAIRGCVTVIRNRYPMAVYTHCHSHMLKLSLMKACTLITEIRK